jgi:hypothetical protein
VLLRRNVALELDEAEDGQVIVSSKRE